MLNFLWFFLINFHLYQSVEFKEPTRVELLDNEEYIISVQYCPWIVYNEYDNNKILINMTTRCYCYNNECSIPGPTLVMYSGSNVTLTVINKMTGSNPNSSFHNTVHDPDVTNIHTHGLHIDPTDENLFVNINPGENLTYNYHILSTHYPGTHWYHAHWHGSVDFQLQNGLAGALLIDEEDKSSWDNNLINMKEHLLMIQWLWISNDCNCNNSTQYSSLTKSTGRFRVNGLCYAWCSNPTDQRTQSGLQYNMNSNIEYDQKEIFLINGQYQPQINNIKIGEYHRLRIVNALGQYYMQLLFPTTNCSFYLIARDGIFFDNENGNGINRDISLSPFNNEILIAPGGRIDVIAKCNHEGIYNIKTSNSSQNFSWLSTFTRADNNIILFTLNVSNNIESNSVNELPSNYPIKPDYINNTLNLNTNEISNITCINYNTSVVTLSQNGIELSGQTNGVNAQKFDENTILLYMLTNHIYEYEISTHYHPYHQHNYPFQVTANDGDGFIIQKGDWIDTIGFIGSNIVRQHTNNFNGDVIVHCHFLSHEDTGMMGIYQIVDSYPSNLNCDTSTSSSNKLTSTLLPTQLPTLIPSRLLTQVPTLSPSILPVELPTSSPSKIETSFSPSLIPTNVPSNNPSKNPTNMPTKINTNPPSNIPSKFPTKVPTRVPSKNPTRIPTRIPTNLPTLKPTNKPTNKPTKKPTKK